MVSAVDVADCIKRRGITDAWAVQKLLYYCQVWSLVWDGEPLFGESIQAWRDGPVCRKVYDEGSTGGDCERLSGKQSATVEAVLNFYGKRSPDWLSGLTHREQPWIDARGGVSARAHTSTPITNDAIVSYYKQYGVPARGFSASFGEALELMVSTPEDVLPISEDRFVDGESMLKWLENGGQGESWARSTG